MDRVDEFTELVRQAMINEYDHLGREIQKMQQDPDWENIIRPRRVLID